MYIGKKRVKGHNYLYVFESVRKGTKVTKKTIAYLGPMALGEKAAKERVAGLRKEGKIPKAAKIALPKTLVNKKRIKKFKPKATLDQTFPEPIKEEVYQILRTLQKHNIKFLVGGMTTMNAYFGVLRVSQDVDIFVTSDASIGRIRLVLKTEGFKTSNKRMARYLPVMSQVLERNESIVDIQTKDSFNITLTKDSIEHSIPMKLRDIELRGMAIEEILLMKKKRNSERDKEDIELIKESLIEEKIELDWGFMEDRAQDWGYSTQFNELKAIFE